MSIWQKAYETYEYLEKSKEGKPWLSESERQALTPVGHIVQKAQITITIDTNGTFRGADAVEETDCKTIIPASLESAARAGIHPTGHPLCDQLKYLSNLDEKSHATYLAELTAWNSSPDAPAKVHAVYKYIQGNTILGDLAKTGLIALMEDGSFAKGKIQGADYASCLVRWRVVGEENSVIKECWKDPSMFHAYQRYYLNRLRERGQENLCLITGEKQIAASSHPKGTVSNAYGAKLISANDESGFTYRGRFQTNDQTATISYVASQKAHSALQWLTANQGKYAGGRTFICWNPKGKPVYQVFDPFMDEAAVYLEPSDYRQALQRTLDGLRNELPDEENVVIAAFDAATTGRLSITYYTELQASDYHNRVASWFGGCSMPNGKHGIQSPSLYRMVLAAFGTEQNEKLDVKDAVCKEQMQRLFRCITDKAPIPADLVQTLRNRASQPLAFANSKNRRAVLFSACCAIRKFYNDRAGREEWTMTLDTQNKDRSYLFGRLLAIMEAAERSTYSRDEGRDPNAIRMQTVYCERPLYAANLIHQSLTPYFEKMTPGLRKYYRNMIGEIFADLSEVDKDKLNKRLEDSYLLGYYLQRTALYTKKNIEEAE